jgi:2-polyprenyl-6-methoxyphenol hydroxylase-like FAD-dependent oxidoreductase
MSKIFNIAVIGAGTAGLAAAICLSRNGNDVSLFERFERPRPIGAGILLQPTGLACLAQLGLDEKALSCGAPVNNLYGEDVNGSTIFDIGYRDLNAHLFGLGIHRGALFSLLFDEVVNQGISITTSCEVIDTTIDNAQRFVIDSDAHRHGPFDLVIDASGLNSGLRASHGVVSYNRPYPYGAVWGVLEDPGQAFCKDYLQQRYAGAGVMIGMLPIGRKTDNDIQSAAFFWSLPAASYPEWRNQGLACWKQRVNGYWPELEPLLNQFESVDDLTFSQYNDTIMQHWHYDRLVFIGDSAHCTSPQLGQGANLGLIDALTLATCLQQTGSINNSLKQFSETRRNHLRFYQLASRLLTPFFQSDSKAAAFVRDKSFGLLCKTPYIKIQMLRTLAGVKTGLFSHLNPGQWHHRYDLKNKI